MMVSFGPSVRLHHHFHDLGDLHLLGDDAGDFDGLGSGRRAGQDGDGAHQGQSRRQCEQFVLGEQNPFLHCGRGQAPGGLPGRCPARRYNAAIYTSVAYRCQTGGLRWKQIT